MTVVSVISSTLSETEDTFLSYSGLSAGCWQLVAEARFGLDGGSLLAAFGLEYNTINCVT